MWRAAGIDMSRVDSRLWHVLGWAFVLELITRTRQLVLVPLTLATAPVLALDGGLDALNAALNVMAVLFIYDVDDYALKVLFSGPQRKYFEEVPFVQPAWQQRHAAIFVCVFATITFFVSFFPILLFDPRTFYAEADADDKFGGIFTYGEPVMTPIFLALATFTAAFLFDSVVKGFCEGWLTDATNITALRSKRLLYFIQVANTLVCAGITVGIMISGQSAASANA